MDSSYCSVKKLVFSDDAGSSSMKDGQQSNQRLVVRILESNQADYGTYVWSSSVVLAQFIWFHRKELLLEKHVLEIGAGTALPSIVAAMCAYPKCIFITDKSENSRTSLQLNGIFNVINLYEENKKLNMVNGSDDVYLLPFQWGEVSNQLFDLFKDHSYPDIILGADCFYDVLLFEKVVASVYVLLRAHFEVNGNHLAKFFCTYQTRSLDWDISDMLELWDLQCVHIPLGSFNSDHSNIACSGMPGDHSIQMMEISLKTENI